jgi:hypothetical protein
MGRYYNTDTGRGGKFGFGKQSSTDPGDFFGMKELEPSEITYTADKDDEEDIKAKVDELYKKLGVPEEERIYYQKGAEDTLSDLLEKYCYRKVNRGEVGRYDRIDGFKHDPYYCEDGVHKVLIEKVEGASLIACRIRLGVIVLSDIKDEGICELTAEL